MESLIAWMVRHPGKAEAALSIAILGLLAFLFFDFFLFNNPTMLTQSILDAGQITGAEPTDVLEEVLAVADSQIRIFQGSTTGTTDVLVTRLQALSAQIIPVLNARRGLDGMTPFTAMTLCKTLPKPLCQPTPFVGHVEAARYVRLPESAAISLKMQLIDDMARVLAGTIKPSDHFPIPTDACLKLIETLTNQLPEASQFLPSANPELQFRLLESQIYQLNQWRFWVECQLAEHMAKADPTTIGGHIAHERIKLMYANLTDLKRRLRAPAS